jgi:hypothetical protein
MLPDISHSPGDSDLDAPVTSEQVARRQTGRGRRFWFWAVLGTPGHDSHESQLGRPAVPQRGRLAGLRFTHSCWPRIPNVRNDWIIWPAMVWVLATAGYARLAFGHKPVSESDIKREIERQAGQRR